MDARHYLALHHCRAQRWIEAEPLLVSVLAQDANRLAAIECLADVRREQGRLGEAEELLGRAIPLQTDPAPALVALGQLRMMMQDTPGAIRAFERAREVQGSAFDHALDLGVCYMASRRFAEARDALDSVREDHPGRSMVLFKRAQVSVLLGESDRVQYVRQAYREGDSTVRTLMRREALFHGIDME
jgi:tetratricopeptide (TPR) repeat protein